jgi:DNA-binding transcriptional ArsR family regulator
MVVIETDGEQADQLFKTLADTTRRGIIQRTMERDYSVSGLARCYPMSFAAIQKHVAVLERAGLVTKHRQGRKQLVRCNIESIRTARRLLKEYETLWRDRIQRFGEILSEPQSGDQHDRPDRSHGHRELEDDRYRSL